MRLPRPRLIEWATIALLALALAAFLAWLVADALDEWAPNIATEALSIAATVAIVERIVRREARDRLRPRVDRAIGHRNVEFYRFVQAVALDYAATHAATYRRIPRDAIQLLEQWVADQDAADMPRIPLPPDDEPLLVQAYEFARQVDQYDHRDRDVLEPELVAAIRDVWGAMRSSHSWRERQAELDEEGLVPPPQLLPHIDGDRNSHRVMVTAARRFGEVLRRYTPEAVFEVPDDTVKWADELRREQMQRHGLAPAER